MMMASSVPSLAFFLLLVSGWVSRHQQAVIDYLLEENRVLARGDDRIVCRERLVRRQLRETVAIWPTTPARS
jgi:hypothetical protein